MGHIPEDENFEEYMDASAEEWSKPEEPAPLPASEPEPTDRWGSPIPEPSPPYKEDTPTHERVTPKLTDIKPPAKKKASKWWIIVIIVVILLCLCVCAVLVGLPLVGINLFESNLLQF